MRPQHILFVEHSVGLSGSTMSLLTLLSRLDRSRFDPHIVLSRPEQADYLNSHLQQPADIAVIAPSRGLKRAVSPQRAFDSRERGKRSQWWPIRKLAALLDIFLVTLPYALRLHRFARRKNMALIHHNNGLDPATILLSRMLGVPLVAYQRGPEWNSILSRWLAPRVTRYIANSLTTRRDLEALGVRPERVSVIYPPLDFGTFDVGRPSQLTKSSLGGDAQTPCFGMVGILVAWKGQRVFLRAAQRVLQRIPEARAVIVGGPPSGGEDYETELRALASDLGIRDRVTFMGFHPDVASILVLLDVVVHASVEPEPFGRVIAEAMAMRRPVIASGAGGPVEIIQDGRSGFLVPPGDDQALANRLIQLLQDPGLAARIGEQGYREVTSRFSAETHVQMVEQVYEEVLQSNWAEGPETHRVRRAHTKRKET